MKPETRKIRQRLKYCSRQEYERLIYESNLTPNQIDVLHHHIQNEKTMIETAEIMGCSERTVSKVLNQAYLKIAQV